METLDLLHKQLESLDELRGIVSTMKALSAASIHQYEQAVQALSGYYKTVERGLHVVMKDMPPAVAGHGHDHEPRRLAAIIFGSDHGLCGRFNEEIARHALERMDSAPATVADRLLLAVGQRVAASLEQQGQSIEDNFILPGSTAQITATVQQILLKVDQWREQLGVHYVFLFYNRHAGSHEYHPTGLQLLPLNLQRFHRLQEERWPSRSLPVYDMDRDALLGRLLNQYLFVTIFRACAESQASEHASRLAAMQSAERNLDEKLEQVGHDFRRARQTVITAELLDVVSGFEAITGAER